ncbi:50S ribosomal protein L25 [Pontiella agarivorans]|uniref:Large ribosomal subunit protein bL25 n=1 Tax=Pontiella agarivorans TaxID=3038953 RepID=A0ABU5MXQ8_9BACT|nr:50S ribosomal protein L25 [Pontiella agarivorans]MDZ8119001.1 50S ribosomal protein L25 [Pontiella agarivorans]
MEDIKLIAKKRELGGSSNSRRLRGEGGLPGVVYGADKEPVSVVVDAHDLEQILHHHASESVMIEIDLEGEGNTRVLVKEVQHHPVTSDLIHVDMQRVVAGQTMQMDIQIELVGEAAGVKAGGTLDHVMHSITVECLPKDVVEAIEIDVSDLEIGQNLHVADLGIDDAFKVLVDDDAIVCGVSGPMADVDEDEEAAAGEPEVLTEKNAE